MASFAPFGLGTFKMASFRQVFRPALRMALFQRRSCAVPQMTSFAPVGFAPAKWLRSDALSWAGWANGFVPTACALPVALPASRRFPAGAVQPAMTRTTLASLGGGADRLVGPLLLAAVGLLAAGLTVPFLSVERFFIFTDRISVLAALSQLVAAGEWLVAAVLFLFSVLFPAAKIGLALWLWHFADIGGSGFARAVRRLEVLGKWSMLDVLVAALLIVSVKASAIADARTEPGLYLFLAAVVLSMVVVHRVRRLADLAATPATKEG